MSERKNYASVAEMLADITSEEDLRDWIKYLWADRFAKSEEIGRLKVALDIKGWAKWFIQLQMAIRGNESLINECGNRIERMRKAVEAVGGEG